MLNRQATHILFSKWGGGFIVNEQKISKNDYANDGNAGGSYDACSATNDDGTS